MEQREIYDLTTEIVYNYAARKNNTNIYFEIMKIARRIMSNRGIYENAKSCPMYATARLIVTRDVINQLEGNAYNTPAEL